MTSHVMVDIETTGTRPDRHAILQIAAVRFDPVKQTVCSQDMFKRSLWMPNTRHWDEETKKWWAGKPDVYADIIAVVEDPKVVINDFIMWCAGDGEMSKSRFFWAKNAQFDYQFLASYFHDFEVSNPFSYRNVNDIKCFLRGKFFPNNLPEISNFVEGTHDALIDCISQIDYLFKAINYDDATVVNSVSTDAGDLL